MSRPTKIFNKIFMDIEAEGIDETDFWHAAALALSLAVRNPWLSV